MPTNGRVKNSSAAYKFLFIISSGHANSQVWLTRMRQKPPVGMSAALPTISRNPLPWSMIRHVKRKNMPAVKNLSQTKILSAKFKDDSIQIPVIIRNKAPTITILLGRRINLSCDTKTKSSSDAAAQIKNRTCSPGSKAFGTKENGRVRNVTTQKIRGRLFFWDKFIQLNNRRFCSSVRISYHCRPGFLHYFSDFSGHFVLKRHFQ